MNKKYEIEDFFSIEKHIIKSNLTKVSDGTATMTKANKLVDSNIKFLVDSIKEIIDDSTIITYKNRKFWDSKKIQFNIINKSPECSDTWVIEK